MIENYACSLGIYGRAKVGKTWLASTAPAPILFLDAEAGGMRFVKRKKRMIDTVNDIEAEDDLPEMTVLQVNDFLTTMRAIRRAAKVGSYKSIIIDSLTELQYKENQKMQVAASKVTYHTWGELRDKTLALIEQCRDMSANGIYSIFILGQKDVADNIIGPTLLGSSADWLTYKLDVLGNLSVVRKDGAYQRKLLLEARPTVIAGSRAGDFWPPEIYNANLEKLFISMTEEQRKYTV